MYDILCLQAHNHIRFSYLQLSEEVLFSIRMKPHFIDIQRKKQASLQIGNCEL